MLSPSRSTIDLTAARRLAVFMAGMLGDRGGQNADNRGG